MDEPPVVPEVKPVKPKRTRKAAVKPPAAPPEALPTKAPTTDPSIPKSLHDFRNFLFLVWMHLNLPAPTWVQYDIAHYLQHGQKRRIIQAFRGVGKSWITSAYVCWRLLMNPQEKILVVSASKERADSFSIFTKRLIADIPILQHLKPSKDQRDSNVAFDVAPALPAQAPSVKSVGITGQITGSRATIIIPDDVEVLNNSATQMQREKLSNVIKEFDAVLSPNGEIIYLGTPQTEESIYNLLPERGYEIRVWPARYPATQKAVDSYQGRLAPVVEEALQKDSSLFWKPTDPKRFNEADLLEREASYGRSGFALQFMLDTSLSDADRYPLKLSDLIVMSLDMEKAPRKVIYASSPELVIQDFPNVGFAGDRLHRPMWTSNEWGDYQGKILAIDPSGRGADETGYAVVAILNSQLFVLDAGAVAGGYDDSTLEALAQIALRCRVNRVLIESNFGDGMFTKLFQPTLLRAWKCPLEEVKSTSMKEARIIDTLEPVMNQHRLIVNRDVIERDSKTPSKLNQLLFQMTRMVKQRGALVHDDRIDVLAMAVAYWAEQMALDVDKVSAEQRADDLKELTENFVDFVFRKTRGGDVGAGLSWNN